MAVLVLAGGILIGGPVALELVPLAIIVFIVVLGYAPRPATPDDRVDARQQQ